MFFRRRLRREPESLGRLTHWALGLGHSASDLEQQFGPEHAQELGVLGRLFSAVEGTPLEEPSLGRWQRWERELRQRLALLPPPRPAFSGLVPPLTLLSSAQPVALKMAVGDLMWKAATVAVATAALTAHVLTSGALDDLRLCWSRPAPSEEVRSESEPTGIALIDQIRAHQRLSEDLLRAGERWVRPGAATQS